MATTLRHFRKNSQKRDLKTCWCVCGVCTCDKYSINLSPLRCMSYPLVEQRSPFPLGGRAVLSHYWAHHPTAKWRDPLRNLVPEFQAECVPRPFCPFLCTWGKYATEISMPRWIFHFYLSCSLKIRFHKCGGRHINFAYPPHPPFCHQWFFVSAQFHGWSGIVLT